MRNDIVVQARLYLELKYFSIFVIAAKFAGIEPDRFVISMEEMMYRKYGKIHKHVEEFCLDVLAKRIRVEWNPQRPEEIRLIRSEDETS